MIIAKPYKNTRIRKLNEVKNLAKKIFLWEFNSVDFENPDILWWIDLANSTEVCKIHKTFLPEKKKPKKKIYLTFAVCTSYCHDYRCTQAIKATKIDISNYDIQENLKTKL